MSRGKVKDHIIYDLQYVSYKLIFDLNSNLLSSNIKGLKNEQYMDFRQNIKIDQPQIPNIFPKSQIPNNLTPKSQNV